MVDERLQPSRHVGSSRWWLPVPRVVAAATLLWVLLLGTWSVVVPIGSAPDELLHLDMATAVREEPGYPGLGDRWLSARWSVVGQLSGRYDRSTQTHLDDDAAVPRPERPSLEDLGPDEPTDFANQMTQHPPGYYALVATAFTAVSSVTPPGWWSWDRVALAYRLLNVLILAPLPVIAHATLAQFRPGPTAVAGSFVPFLLPQLGFIGGTVNNDNLVVVAFWVATLLVARVLTGDRSLRTAALLGLAVAVAAFTKAFGLILVPWVVVAYVVGAPRAWGENARRLVVCGSVSLLGLWWYGRLVLTEGEPFPEPEIGGLADWVPLGPEWQPQIGTFLQGVLRPLAVTYTWHTGTGPIAFGLGSSWALVWISVLVALAVLGVVTGRPDRLRLAVLVGIVPVHVVAILPRSWDYYVTYGRITAVQGRYLFGSVLALGVGVVVGVGWLVRSRPRLAPVVVGAPALVLCGLVLWRTVRGYWGPAGGSVGESWAALTAWSPLPVAGTTALVGALGAATALVAVLAGAGALGGDQLGRRGAVGGSLRSGGAGDAPEHVHADHPDPVLQRGGDAPGDPR